MLFRPVKHKPIPPGAEIISKDGQRFARWRGRSKKLVTAPITTADDGTETVAVPYGIWSARYTDHNGRSIQRSTGCRDEANARQKLAEWVREVERIKAGILDPAELRTARTASKPLEEHLLAWQLALVAADVTKNYRMTSLSAVRRIASEAGFEALADIRRDQVESWLATQREAGMTARTRNHYRDALVCFMNWCIETDRLRTHDLDRLPKADRRLDPRRNRRAMTHDEFARFLAAVAQRPGIGRERALVWKTLVYTGLRFNELKTLTVAHLDLTPGSESLQLAVRNEKGRYGSTLPLRADLAADLRTWISERRLAAGDRLFRLPHKLTRQFDADLKAAGIPKRDERGRTLDVHALRTTYATWLSMSGVAPRSAQAAMRHSDIRLTMQTYTDPKLLEIRKAVEALPGISLLEGQQPDTRTTPRTTSGTTLAPVQTGQNGTSPVNNSTAIESSDSLDTVTGSVESVVSCDLLSTSVEDRSECEDGDNTTPRLGLEPRTVRLTVGCSTIELSRNNFFTHL
jgi:integrase